MYLSLTSYNPAFLIYYYSFLKSSSAYLSSSSFFSLKSCSWFSSGSPFSNSCSFFLKFFSIFFYFRYFSSACSSKKSTIAYSFSSWSFSNSFLQFSSNYLISGSTFDMSYFFAIDLLFLLNILHILLWLFSLTVRSWWLLSSSINKIISSSSWSSA